MQQTARVKKRISEPELYVGLKGSRSQKRVFFSVWLLKCVEEVEKELLNLKPAEKKKKAKLRTTAAKR